jgi:hypothetical protein
LLSSLIFIFYLDLSRTSSSSAKSLYLLDSLYLESRGEQSPSPTIAPQLYFIMPGRFHLRSQCSNLTSVAAVPLAFAAPAALASLAYLDARTGLSYDWAWLGNGIYSQFTTALKEKRDRLNVFYKLEEHALGKHANTLLLIFEGRQWTYKEVYQTALKYGTWMKTRYNIKPKDIIAMDFVNSEKFIFIWLGLWAIGAKPAFINYNLTGKALAHCIKVSTTSVVLVDLNIKDNITQEVQDDLPNVQFEIFDPKLEAEAVSTEGIREPDDVRTDDKSHNMGILIYTSGTTGLPKGAIVSWKKILVASGLVPTWMGMTKRDVFYTVGLLQNSITSLTENSACLYITPRPPFWASVMCSFWEPPSP